MSNITDITEANIVAKTKKTKKIKKTEKNNSLDLKITEIVDINKNPINIVINKYLSKYDEVLMGLLNNKIYTNNIPKNVNKKFRNSMENEKKNVY
jgi:hypothetical protein